MEHWLDRLAKRQTRRATLKAAGVAGATLVLPLGRLTSASASSKEPCFLDCLLEGNTQWLKDNAACEQYYSPRSAASYVDILGGVVYGTVMLSLLAGKRVSCRAAANAAWHKAVIECRRPQCGDRAKYPGGNAPVAVCTGYGPGYIPCGPTPQDCCDGANAECCQCKSGKLICCRLGAECSCCGSGG